MDAVALALSRPVGLEVRLIQQHALPPEVTAISEGLKNEMTRTPKPATGVQTCAKLRPATSALHQVLPSALQSAETGL
eukprot:CAMPEP_0168320566 /NCGR_PEP_ID=MMETSP0213-20121227/1753_1 /TAXON_ID=151035 /ORGANISM="Euplotes harpa, Strain FSP1.4" /LENGTH=77 /DNA_ID=CAMNT_0008322053 /DNA_START=674 /DNA_END=907 /DNA_ORIENTATION=-